MSEITVKLGVVGLDGHGPVFTEQVNGSEPKLPGAKVVAALSFPSGMYSDEQLSRNIEKTRQLGAKIADSPAQLAKGVDGILILHDDGSKHLELARLFAEMGKPVFVDKPFEVNVKAAEELVDVFRKNKCPLFSASSLRFSNELRGCLENPQAGQVRSAMTYSPFDPRPSMPGWIYYGVHAVEPLFALMGRGCREVRCVDSATGPCAIGVWPDGRIGLAKGTIGGVHGFGFTVWQDKSTVASVVDSSKIYQSLLKEIKKFIETGTSPVAPEESVDVIAFMEAANRSLSNHGNPEAIQC